VDRGGLSDFGRDIARVVPLETSGRTISHEAETRMVLAALASQTRFEMVIARG
jgi:hypothetical protein